jgi:hypothetical protein
LLSAVNAMPSDFMALSAADSRSETLGSFAGIFASAVSIFAIRCASPSSCAFDSVDTA